MAAPVKHYGGWRIRWFDEDGKRCSKVYPSFREAEYSLKRHETHVEEIKRGLRKASPPAKTFGELCDYYQSNYSIHKRRRRDDESIIKVHLRPHLGAGLLLQINWVQEINSFRLHREHLNKKTLHNILTLLVSMLIVAKDLKWIDEVPKIKKPRLRLFDKDFCYLKTKDEIFRFLVSAREEGDLVHALYATAVYTGLREGELAGLKWENVDLDKRLITVQSSFDGPTKSGELRFVPILDPLLPVLKRWRLRCLSPFVFPNEANKMQQESARIFQEVFHRVLDRADFPRIKRAGKERRYIVFHELRHTFASHWVMNGGDIFRLQKILGHKSVQMTSRYSHLCPEVFTEDYQRFGTNIPSDFGQVVQINS